MLLKQQHLLLYMKQLAFLQHMRGQASPAHASDRDETQHYDAQHAAEGWKQVLAKSEQLEPSKPKPIEPKRPEYTPEELTLLRADTLELGKVEEPTVEPQVDPSDTAKHSETPKELAEQKPQNPEASAAEVTALSAPVAAQLPSPCLTEASMDEATDLHPSSAASGQEEQPGPLPTDCPSSDVPEAKQGHSCDAEVEDELENTARLAEKRAAEDAMDVESSSPAKEKEAEKMRGTLNKNLVVRGTRLPDGWCNQGFISPVEQAKLAKRKPKAEASEVAKGSKPSMKQKATKKAKASSNKPKGCSSKAKAKARGRRKMTRASSSREWEVEEHVKPRRNTGKTSTKTPKQETKKRLASKAPMLQSKRRRRTMRGTKRAKGFTAEPAAGEQPTPEPPVRRVRQRASTLADEAKARRSRKSSAYHCKFKEMKDRGMDIELAREHAKMATCCACKDTL